MATAVTTKRLQLFRPNEYDDELRTIPIYWYVPGISRLIQLQLWWGRGFDTSGDSDRIDLKDVTLEIFEYSAELEGGHELSEKGWVSINGTIMYPGVTVNVGDIVTNGYQNIDFIFYSDNNPDYYYTPGLQPDTKGYAFLRMGYSCGDNTNWYGEGFAGDSFFGGQDNSRLQGLSSATDVTFMAFVVDTVTAGVLEDAGFEL